LVAGVGKAPGNVRKIAAAFLVSAALPFARILSADRVEYVFAKHDGHDGLVVSRPGVARRQGGFLPSSRGL
jgi:hypothetical protein